MNIDFDLEVLVSTEDMKGIIPIAMEASIMTRCNYQHEKPVYYPNDEAYPGYEATEMTGVRHLYAMVDWYTPAPDGTMTVYHVIGFHLEGEMALDWLSAWKVDLQDIVDKEGITLEGITLDDIMED